MAYVALKPCSFAGQSFRIGDCVPDELIHPGAADNLVKMQVIAAENGEINSPGISAPVKQDGPISIRIPVEEGTLDLEVSRKGLQEVFTVMSGKTTEAERTIEQITDGDALILLHVCDSRKAVKIAAEARAKALNQEESEGEL